MRVTLDVPQRGDGGAARSVRLRQDDDAAHDRRLRAGEFGGDILLDGRSILDLPAHRREMGIVFQSYALFPHLTVARNIAFGLEMRRRDRRARSLPASPRCFDLVKLDGFADRLPRQLSGGQQQRVALARALAIRPKVLLLDEPLSNLDAALRQEVAREIRILQRGGTLTAIMVTHDQDEAMAMADRLVVMRDGSVQQIGTQEDLYERPANPFVARFIGHSNMLSGRLADRSTFLLADGGRVAPRRRLCGAVARRRLRCVPSASRSAPSMRRRRVSAARSSSPPILARRSSMSSPSRPSAA